MTTKRFIFSSLAKRRIATLGLLSLLTAGAFATLGDGSSNKKSKVSNVLSDRSITIKHNGFSLKSGYNYRGNNVINTVKQDVYINLNTVATYQKGNRTYILPIKSKVLLNNVKFSAGVPQLNK
jgi:hypothetical protein